MKKITRLLLCLSVFLFSCQSKGKFDGVIVLTWIDNSESRGDDATVLEDRLKKLGITKYTIDINSNNEIEVGLKNVSDTSLIIEMMMYNDLLAFWETYDNSEAFPMLDELNSRLSGNREMRIDSNQTDSAYEAERKRANPLWSIMQCSYYIGENNSQYLRPGPEVGWCKAGDMKEVDSLLKFGYNTCFPNNIFFTWALSPFDDDSTYALIALKKSVGTGGAFMGQDVIIDSRIDKNNNQKAELTLTLDERGTKIFEKMTEKNIGKCIAITLGNKVVTYPSVQNKITKGILSVTGPDDSKMKLIHHGLEMKQYKSKPATVSHHFWTKSK